jgi:phosphoglycerate dehydrogenase-like enzyme
MIRLGVEDSIDNWYLRDLPTGVELIRLPAEPQEDIEIDFWITSLSNATSRRQVPHLKALKVVQALTAGVDALIDLVPAGAKLCDSRGVHDIPTAEWAVTAILAMQKNLPFLFEIQRQADWSAKDGAGQIHLLSRDAFPNPSCPVLVDEIADKTILIVGYGAIGKAIEDRLAPFGPRFVRVARSERAGVEPVARLDDHIPQADIIVLMTPLTSETRHLMNGSRIARMKPGALLVNAARGAVVETDALVAALHERRIRAAVDVTDPEPLPPTHPLWKAPNLLITPHVATDSSMFRKRAFKFASEQVERYLRGEELLNIVTGEY